MSIYTIFRGFEEVSKRKSAVGAIAAYKTAIKLGIEEDCIWISRKDTPFDQFSTIVVLSELEQLAEGEVLQRAIEEVCPECSADPSKGQVHLKYCYEGSR